MTLKSIIPKYFSHENIELAYYRVKFWPERLIKDRFGINAFGDNLDDNISHLREKIDSGNYRPQKGFKFYEPKSSGTQRTKTLLMIEDALVYQAIANVIAEQSYDQLSENEDFVFGSVLVPETKLGIELLKAENPLFFFFKFWKSLYGRFKQSVIKAIEEDKVTYKFETDITGFFDSIPHYNLLDTLSKEFNVEDEILDILSECFNAWSGTKENSTPGVGIPQGPLPSFLIANLLLYPLDKQLISEASKYYRYMDDIKIYAYSEDELLDVLVKIDNYLKSYGLSINSKKTSIKRIDPDQVDDTVKELKRITVLGEMYDGSTSEPIERSISIDEEISKNLSTLTDQTPQSVEEKKTSTEVLKSKEEIIKFWQSEINSVESELPGLFEKNTVELIDSVETDDLHFIRLSAKYGIALKELSDYLEVKADETLIKYWLFALKKYFWRAGNFTITLQHYKNNKELKSGLLELFIYGKNYESFRYHLIICLTYNFNYTDRELREFFKTLKQENSSLVRYAIYCLIIKHSDDPQLRRTLRSHLACEPGNYLKLMVLEYLKKDINRIDSMEDLMNSVGL